MALFTIVADATNVVKKGASMTNKVTQRVSWVLSAALLATVMVVGPFASQAQAGDRVDMSPIPPDPREERVHLRAVGEGFKLRRSQHYSILYDTSEEDVKVFQRGIERTYRWCMRYCLSLDIPVHKPEKKLITHFFNIFNDYARYSIVTGGGGVTPGTLGYFSPQSNYTYFYNYRNRPDYKAFRDNAEREIKRLQEQFKGAKTAEEKQAIRERIKQLKKTMTTDSTDGGEVTEATLQHEVAHQVLFNIGFHNERAALKLANPRWFAEGLASLFEPVGDGKASGFGALNEERHEQYRHLVRVGGLIPLKTFVADIRWFFQPDTGGRAYPQAWALVHYLTRTKREEMRAYVTEINERTVEYEMTPEKELALFEKHFGEVDDTFEERWKEYMETIH